MGEIEDRFLENVINAKCYGIVCEKCGSNEITEISYGLPGWLTVDEPVDPRIEKLIEERRIVLGGCIKGEKSPRYYCRACSNKFGIFNSNN